jgi:hypothetical protein
MHAPYWALRLPGPLGQDESVRLRVAYLLAWALATTIVAGASWLSIHSILSAPTQTRNAYNSVPGYVNVPSSPRPSSSRTPGVTAPAPNPSWSPVSNGAGGTAYRRTIRTVGGDVAVWVEPGTARVQETVPRDGYEVEIRRLSDEAVEVTFVNDRTISRVSFRWWSTAPYAEVAESVG